MFCMRKRCDSAKLQLRQLPLPVCACERGAIGQSCKRSMFRDTSNLMKFMQISVMFAGVTGCTLHFPSDLGRVEESSRVATLSREHITAAKPAFARAASSADPQVPLNNSSILILITQRLQHSAVGR